MRRLLSCRFFCLLLLTVVFPAPAVFGRSTSSENVDRASAALAARLVLERLYSDAENQSDVIQSSLRGVLRDEMLSNPGKYVDPKTAETEMAQSYRNFISERYHEDAVAILDRLSEGKGRESMFGAEFLSEAEKLPDDVAEKSLRKNYAKVFSDARKEACDKQFSQVSAKIIPAVEEVDSSDRDSLVKVVSERIASAQSFPIFSENIPRITSDMAAPTVDDAYRQRTEQREFVERTNLSGYAPSVLAGELQSRLESYLNRLRSAAKPGEHIYGVFPSVAGRDIANEATGSVVRVYCDAVKTVNVSLDADSILKRIETEPARHITLNDSLNAFLPSLTEELRSKAMEKCASAAPPEQRGEFRTVMETVKNEQQVTQTVNSVVDLKFITVIKAKRKECAEKQFEKIFPSLYGRTWVPSASLVDTVCDGGNLEERLSRWREIAGLETFVSTADAAKIMEETSVMLDAAVVSSLKEGASARSGQHGIVDDVYGVMKSKFVNSGRTVKLPEIIAAFREEVSIRWENDRKILLKIADGQKDDGRYKELFPSTVEKLEMLARALMESLEKERENVKEPEPDPTVEDSTTSPEEQIEEIDASVRIRLSGANIVFELVVSGDKVGEYSCPFDAAGYRTSISSVVSGISSAFVDRLRTLAGNAAVSVTLNVEVHDGMIYYGAVKSLSSRFSSDVSSLGDRIHSFSVSDGAFGDWSAQ